MLWFLGSIGAQSFPEIRILSSTRDLVFQQHQEALAQFHRSTGKGDDPPPLQVFEYELKEGDTLITLSSRTGISQEALATLNGLSRAQEATPGRRMMIPSQPGIFLLPEGSSELSSLMAAVPRPSAKPPQTLLLPGKQGLQTVEFHPGQRFSPLERAFFLGILFRFPLKAKMRLTSLYGTRRDPFSGHPSFHNGVDLGASEGTEVLAAREGRVTAAGFDRVFGNFVLLEHPGGYETLYGHLKGAVVSLNQRVSSGTIIGRVGSTGMSTGPHLHFEIRRKGHPQDPVPLLPR